MTCDRCLEGTELYPCAWCSRILCETCMNKHECKGKGQ